MNTSPHIFTLDLGDGSRCTARVDVEKISELTTEDLPSVVSFGWEGTTHSRHWPRFMDWMVTIWQHVADLANKSISCLMVTPGGKPFVIVFEPHQRPQTLSLPNL